MALEQLKKQIFIDRKWVLEKLNWSSCIKFGNQKAEESKQKEKSQNFVKKSKEKIIVEITFNRSRWIVIFRGRVLKFIRMLAIFGKKKSKFCRFNLILRDSSRKSQISSSGSVKETESTWVFS